MPKKTIKHILYSTLSQTRKKLIFGTGDGGHFEFRALKSYAHTFDRGMGAKFLFYPSKKSNPMRNVPPLSVVTELMKMTQLQWYSVREITYRSIAYRSIASINYTNNLVQLCWFIS